MRIDAHKAHAQTRDVLNDLHVAYYHDLSIDDCVMQLRMYARIAHDMKGSIRSRAFDQMQCIRDAHDNARIYRRVDKYVAYFVAREDQ